MGTLSNHSKDTRLDLGFKFSSAFVVYSYVFAIGKIVYFIFQITMAANSY